MLVDGGLRRSTDVVKALARGAEAVLIGRPYLHGLAVAGAAGVARSVYGKNMKNISDFNAMNEVYGRYFKSAPPARTTVGVAALPGDALVEIEVVAVLPSK